jgi:hypothetical protein
MLDLYERAAGRMKQEISVHVRYDEGTSLACQKALVRADHQVLTLIRTYE